MDFKRISSCPFVLILLLTASNEVESTCNERCHKCDEATDTCKECRYGWYGYDCNRECQNCQLSICNRSGICDQCNPGRYREDCESPCPSNCRSDSTKRVFCGRWDGECLDGCKKGWWGDTCNRKCNDHCDDRGCYQINGHCIGDCRPGWWGLTCEKTCPVGCKDHRCGSMNGKCVYGCKVGFTSVYCDETCNGGCEVCDQYTRECLKCPDSLYGRDCAQECGENCIGYQCDMQGRCTNGCRHGFTGATCQDVCPFNCLRCEQEGNICTRCKLGWTGSRCDNHTEETELIVPAGEKEDEAFNGILRDSEGNSEGLTGNASQRLTFSTITMCFAVHWSLKIKFI